MMKRLFCLLFSVLLLLTGCGGRKADLHLDSLTVSVGTIGGPELVPETDKFSDTLKAAFAEAGVEIDEVKVTASADQEAAAQAVDQGKADLAILSAETFAAAGTGGVPLLADAWPDGEEELLGREALVCAAPTAAGKAIAGEKAPEWDQLAAARWGVLAPTSDLGSRYLSLWISTGWPGRTLADLPNVKEYDSFGSLLRAAGRGEIDLFPCTRQSAEELEEAWTVPADQTDETGYKGLGRTEPLWDEVHILDTMPICLDRVMVVRDDPSLAEGVFPEALDKVVDALSEDPDFVLLAGTAWFAPVTAEDLAPLAQLPPREPVSAG